MFIFTIFNSVFKGRNLQHSPFVNYRKTEVFGIYCNWTVHMLRPRLSEGKRWLMSDIRFIEQGQLFKLDTENTTYMIKLADEEKFVLHMYYGKRLSSDSMPDLCRLEENPFVPSVNNRDRCSFYDCAPFEYPAHGIGDYREAAFSVKNKNGHSATTLNYVSHNIIKGKPALKGLPATFGREEECKTLELVCEDAYNGLEVVLYYSVFEDVDAITRSVVIKNKSTDSLKLTRVMSACLELDEGGYDTVFLHGSWARERTIDRKELGFGKHYVSSVRGESSHQEHPFIGVFASDATEDTGEVYGLNFVYSGNFVAQAERSQFGTVRVMMGISPVDFEWNLGAGEEFTAPEVAMVYSAEGIGKMTRTYHNLYRRHLIRSEYRSKMRPILINNWEATYFDFNTDKLLSIAREAERLGIEMLVMDDGWFGCRNDDNNSLGDWFVNESKLPGGLKYLVDEVNKIGLKFGIWMEPEMISPDSELFRAHPDWAIQLPGKTGSLARNQYVLDLSRPEVVEYTYSQISRVLHSANIEYLKWDMNRQLCDIGSIGLDREAQGELFHRYCLGVYELQERLVREFPQLLLENCSGGGARFDPGMLYYSPQIWCSDNTDAISRLSIQHGTSLIYPLSAMGAHVSDCPNHTVGRVTPFETRGYVALAGTFGYELDVTRISEADRSMIPAQVKMYHSYSDLVRNGDYYRLLSADTDRKWDAWEVVSEDKSEALVTVVRVLNEANVKSKRLRLKGLDAHKTYRVACFDIASAAEDIGHSRLLGGDVLMYAGINIAINRDFGSRLMHLTACD